MKKIFSIVLILALATMVFAGCSTKKTESADSTKQQQEKQNTTSDTKDDSTQDTKQETKETFNLKIATVSVPGDAHTEALSVFKEEIEKTSDGQIKVEIFHSGSLYSQDELFPNVTKGNIDICFLSAPWLTDYVPSLTMFTAGYIFKDYDHMTKVYNGEIGQAVFENIAKELDIRPLSAWYLGARQINLREDKAVMTPEDLSGVKLRMPNSPAWLFLGEALGANPTPLSFSELYMALKTGTVDGQDNPLPTVQNAKFFEVTKSISLTNHVIDTVWPTINEDKWQKLGSDLQQKVLDAMEVARKACDEQTQKSEQELVSFFKEQGLSIYEADVEAFRNHVLQKYLDNKEMTSTWDMDLFDEIQALAK